MVFKPVEARTIICPVCKKTEKEPFFGMGFPGWIRLMDIFDDKTKENPVFCPECKKNLFAWINGEAKIVLNETKKEKEK
jgi:hypothetical protein